VFIVWYSIPGEPGSFSWRIAEWAPDVVGFTLTFSVTGEPFGRPIDPAELIRLLAAMAAQRAMMP